MSGTEKLDLFVIGKSAKPRCFKNVKSLPVIYKSNKKAWMTSKLFEEYMLDLDRKFELEKRKVLMFSDNCPSHPKMQNKLQNIQLEFFPPNMTSTLQPMDLGIIQNLKVHYRKKVLKKCLINMEKNLPSPTVNLLESILILADVWKSDVKCTTIANYFSKAGFYPEIEILQEEDTEINIYEEQFDNLHSSVFDSFHGILLK
jgi:hypothetical protein